LFFGWRDLNFGIDSGKTSDGNIGATLEIGEGNEAMVTL